MGGRLSLPARRDGRVRRYPTPGYQLPRGLGRYLTRRGWFERNTTLDPDKIICWEYPNFDEHILKSMDERFDCRYFSAWPLQLPLLDMNLVIKFIYRKS